MQITKFDQSCLLVETADQTVLFDPGVMSAEALLNRRLDRLHAIAITHRHGDHLGIDLVVKLAKRFPGVQITAPADAVAKLQEAGIEQASTMATTGLVIFESPHDNVAPLYESVEQFGYHYLDELTVPGDSMTFDQTKPTLALPMQGPFGSPRQAVALALTLQPRRVIPIHDWHWHDQARASYYETFTSLLKAQGIEFLQPVKGEPFTI